MNCVDIIIAVLLGLAIGFALGIILFECGDEIKLTQEVADDICFHLTGNLSAVASTIDDDWRGNGKLVCEIPSFDDTQNIIIRENSDKN